MTRKLTGKLSGAERLAALARVRKALPPRAGPRADRPFASPPVSKFVAAKTVGTFVPGLTKKAFEKYGFAAATLLTDWETIVGREMASYTSPERLKWPRMTGASGDADPDAARPGGTLHLRVDPARALDVEYRARQIAERINAYFGYRAVETVRLIQAPLLGTQAKAPRAAAPPQAPVAKPAEPGLSAALARMQKNIAKKSGR